MKKWTLKPLLGLRNAENGSFMASQYKKRQCQSISVITPEPIHILVDESSGIIEKRTS